MRFLFINQYYAPDFAATAQQMSDLCEKLAANGHDVHVLASQAIYDGRTIKLPAYEVINGVHVHRVKISSAGREKFRDRLYGYASFYWNAFLKVNFLPKPDVVVALTTPPLISLLGAWLRLTRRVRFVYWVMDVYPDIAFIAGVIRRKGPVRAFWSTLARASYLAANRIVVLGDDMKKVLSQKGRIGHKITTLRSWASAEEISPLPKAENSFRRDALGAPEFALMYSGNMGTCHTFDAVITGIKKLRDRSDLRFAFIGGGKQAPRLKKELAADCPNVCFLPYQDRSALKMSLSAPDAHLITLDPRYDGLLVPSKVYGIMAAARAILFVGSRNNEIGEMVERIGCGIVVDPAKDGDFVDAVNWMASHPEEVAAMGERGHQHFLAHLEKEILTDEFARLLEEEGLKPGVRGVRALAHKTLAFAGHPSKAEPHEPKVNQSNAHPLS